MKLIAKGAIDQLGSAAKKSMIWRHKESKAMLKKHGKSADAAAAQLMKIAKAAANL